MTVMHMTITALALLALITSAIAQPLPQPKVGQCPSGYMQSGNYCAPMNDKSKPAVPKVGQCPSGWMQSGGACQDMRRR